MCLFVTEQLASQDPLNAQSSFMMAVGLTLLAIIFPTSSLAAKQQIDRESLTLVKRRRPANSSMPGFPALLLAIDGQI